MRELGSEGVRVNDLTSVLILLGEGSSRSPQRDLNHKTTSRLGKHVWLVSVRE